MTQEDKKSLYALDLFQRAWDKMDEQEMHDVKKIPRTRYKPKIIPQHRTLGDIILAMRGYKDYASLLEIIPAFKFLIVNGWKIRPCAVCRRGAFSYKTMNPVLCATCQNFEEKILKEKPRAKIARELRRMRKLVQLSKQEAILLDIPKFSVPPVSAEDDNPL